jgi:hypothetical protein
MKIYRANTLVDAHGFVRALHGVTLFKSRLQKDPRPTKNDCSNDCIKLTRVTFRKGEACATLPRNHTPLAVQARRLVDSTYEHYAAHAGLIKSWTVDSMKNQVVKEADVKTLPSDLHTHIRHNPSLWTKGAGQEFRDLLPVQFATLSFPTGHVPQINPASSMEPSTTPLHLGCRRCPPKAKSKTTRFSFLESNNRQFSLPISVEILCTSIEAPATPAKPRGSSTSDSAPGVHSPKLIIGTVTMVFPPLTPGLLALISKSKPSWPLRCWSKSSRVTPLKKSSPRRLATEEASPVLFAHETYTSSIPKV